MSKVNVSKLNTLKGHNDCVYTLEKTQFDNKFFSGAGDGMVACWDLDDPENGQLIAKLPNSIYGLNYSQKLDLLAVGHNYDGVHFINWQEKKEVGSLNMTKAAIFDIKSYDNYFIVGDASGLLTTIDPNTLQAVAKKQSPLYFLMSTAF
ncbi:MAG: WD40 repeat domain-containing protein, partial [Bacteroidota bacterium]